MSYSNECALEVANCKSSEKITKVSDGECGAPQPTLFVSNTIPLKASDMRLSSAADAKAAIQNAAPVLPFGAAAVAPSYSGIISGASGVQTVPAHLARAYATYPSGVATTPLRRRTSG